MLYTSVGNPTQTMKSSACGPTSAAIIVSSSKGAILPTTMARLFVDNGYRTAGNGTAWAAFPFVADYFDFKEYHVTSNFNTAMSYLKQDKDNDGNADYFIVASCRSGLFTSGGHYITLMRNNNGTIMVYDPYLYAGKFNTASRRAAGVVVSGNAAYVSESSFIRYGNASNYWIFSNDKGDGQGTASNVSKPSSVSYTRYVATQSLSLNVRRTAGGAVIGSLRKGTAVNVVETTGGWSRINSPVSGWVSSSYLSSASVNYVAPTNNQSYTSSTGATYKLKSTTTLYASSSMRGTYYTYLPKTAIRVLNHVNSSIDYVYIPATGRYAYCYTSAYGVATSTSSSSVSNSGISVGKTYKLISTTTLYSKASLSGTYYTYLPKTAVKVLSKPSSYVAYVYIPATGRYAYVRTSALR